MTQLKSPVVFDLVARHGLQDRVPTVHIELSNRIARLQEDVSYFEALPLWHRNQELEGRAATARSHAHNAIHAFLIAAGQGCVREAEECLKAGDMDRCNALMRASGEFLELIEGLDSAASPASLFENVFGIPPGGAA